MTYWLVTISYSKEDPSYRSVYSVATYAAARRKESMAWKGDPVPVATKLESVEGALRTARRRDLGRPSTLPGRDLSGRPYNA